MAYGSLTIQHVDGRREPLTIEKPIVRIGRDRSNDIVLGGLEVEGYHAEILADPTGMQILDLGTANGTEVDGQRILGLPQPLGDGSVIRIGGARISVAIGGQQGPAVAAVTSGAQPDTLLEGLLAAGPATVRRQETQPLPAAPPPPPANLTVTLRPADLAVEPGKAVQASVEVANRGVLEERVRLSVDGPAEWAAILPDELIIPPGQRGEAQLLFNPPRAPESRAGTHQFQLVATPDRAGVGRFMAVGRLSVAAYTDYRFELLDPRARTGWRGGRYSVQIRNGGNLALPFTLAGSDELSAFRYKFRPEPLVVEPGETRRSRLTATLRNRRLFVDAQNYGFTVTAAPGDDSAPAQQAQGRLVQRAVVPPWILVAILWLLGLSLLLGLFALTVPRIVQAWQSRPTPAPTLPPTLTPLPLTPSPEVAPTQEVLPTIESLAPPAPIVIVPTVVINIPPAPPPPAPIVVPPVTVPVVQTPAPLPPDRSVVFNKLNGNDVGQRSPIRGDEYFGQGMTLCMYREIALPAPPGPGPQPNDPPQTVDNLTLSVSDDPDPVSAGGQLNLRVDLSNSLAGRRFYQVAITARPPAGAAFAQPGDARCVVQPDGSVVCNFPELGDDNQESFTLPLIPTQPGAISTEVEAVALAGDDATAPARTLSVKARAQTTVVGPPPPVADCGGLSTQIIQESLAARNPQSFMFQVPPVIYPPPAGNLQIPLHSLTSDSGPDQFAGDAIAAIAFPRPAVEVAVTVFFPGPSGNFIALYGVDEQGKLISTARTDRLTVPGLYQLVLKGIDRPVRLALIQSAAAEGPGPVAVSSGGIFITKVEINYTSR